MIICVFINLCMTVIYHLNKYAQSRVIYSFVCHLLIYIQTHSVEVQRKHKSFTLKLFIIFFIFIWVSPQQQQHHHTFTHYLLQLEEKILKIDENFLCRRSRMCEKKVIINRKSFIFSMTFCWVKFMCCANEIDATRFLFPPKHLQINLYILQCRQCRKKAINKFLVTNFSSSASAAELALNKNISYFVTCKSSWKVFCHQHLSVLISSLATIVADRMRILGNCLALIHCGLILIFNFFVCYQVSEICQRKIPLFYYNLSSYFPKSAQFSFHPELFFRCQYQRANIYTEKTFPFL